MILRALLIMHQGTFNQIIDAIGEINRVQAWHEIERLYSQKLVDRYSPPHLSGEWIYFLTEKGRKKANKARLDKPIQRGMFD